MALGNEDPGVHQMSVLIITFTRLQTAIRARSERGASLVEYALVVALIAMVCIAAVSALGSTTSRSFSEMTSELG